MDIPTIQPSRLRKGNTIAIVAPGSTVEQPDLLKPGIGVLEQMGFRVRFDERIFEISRYLAGEDHSRAEELMRAFEDPSVRGIVALRGGYGCSRLIPLLMEKRLRQNPKVFMGFSDITTLHLFFRRRFGWITFHGPMAAAAGFGKLPGDQQQHLIALWTDPGYRPQLTFPQLETIVPGIGEGVLTGGCLSLIVTSIGTAYEINTDDKVLFLEDHGEPPYRLDRMLMHLQLAGKLESVAGLVLGNFPGCEPTQGNYTAMDTLREVAGKLHVPVLANFPAGHGAENWALPLGARVRVDAEKRSLDFLEPAVS
jgi:muramoyltetrapeptide carboxypeptidase